MMLMGYYIGDTRKHIVAETDKFMHPCSQRWQWSIDWLSITYGLDKWLTVERVGALGTFGSHLRGEFLGSHLLGTKNTRGDWVASP
jgi:hypothetical protein